MIYAIYYQNQKMTFKDFTSAYNYSLILKADCIEYSFRLETKK